MSTKIYEAYRLTRSSDLWPFLNDARAKATRNIKRVLLNVLYRLAGDVDTKSEDYQEAIKSFPEDRARLYCASRTLQQEYEKQIQSPRKNMYDFTASLAVRERSGRLYVIPYRGMPFTAYRGDPVYADVFSFLRRDPRLTDFAYWNNTDRPEHITAREWNARKRVWYGMFEDGSIDTFVTLDLVQPDSFYRLDPYSELIQKGHFKKPGTV